MSLLVDGQSSKAAFITSDLVFYALHLFVLGHYEE